MSFEDTLLDKPATTDGAWAPAGSSTVIQQLSLTPIVAELDGVSYAFGGRDDQMIIQARDGVNWAPLASNLPTLAVQPLLATAPHRFATEVELGSALSIPDYDHGAVFPSHYSRLKTPIVRLSAAGRLLQRLIEGLRSVKQSLRG